jgi:hypothetical protein
MASTGAAKATSPEPVLVKVQGGIVSHKHFTAKANQRVVFQNGDDREYRLRLRRGYRSKPLDLCVFLPANGSADLWVDPIVAKIRGNEVGVEVIPALEICAAGPIKGGPGNPPKGDLGIAVSNNCTQTNTQ